VLAGRSEIDNLFGEDLEEVERLFVLIRRLREQGLAIIYISHHLPELHEIADRITILRDGKKVVTSPDPAQTSMLRLAEPEPKKKPDQGGPIRLLLSD